MAAQAGSISATTIGSIEMPTAILGFFNHDKFEESALKWLQQRPTTRNSNMVAHTGNT